ncbi:hypothetical protein J3458_012912 [Metarhizium acridum]|uniref:uncharacterized protein n=1 Tax=Metarhizium acridum TaxID=92637 RepID=UPI001C6AEDC4|nr:hypothetical protein J3458_012912 [Metarhizium acridum]
MTAQDNYCRRLDIGQIDEKLRDRIIDSLSSLEQTKYTDAQRGGNVWVYEDTGDIKTFTEHLMSMHTDIKRAVEQDGLEPLRNRKQPKVIVTDQIKQDRQFIDPNQIVILSPMTHDTVSLWVSREKDCADAKTFDTTKADTWVIIGGTRFHLPVPYHTMPLPVQKI